MPDVPPVFRWRDSGGKEILVVYQSQYGDAIDLGDCEYVIEMTGDNVGPHQPAAVKRILKRYPDAKVQSATLNDLARKLLKKIDSYPVITSEIGDTWIHGIGSDPKKVADFKELLRLRNSWKEDFPEKGDFSRLLLEAAEHTWGLDEKTHYVAPRAWTPKKLKNGRRAQVRLLLEGKAQAPQESHGCASSGKTDGSDPCNKENPSVRVHLSGSVRDGKHRF